MNFNQLPSIRISSGSRSSYKKYLFVILSAILVSLLLLKNVFKANIQFINKDQVSHIDKNNVNPHLIYEETFEGDQYFPLRGNEINKVHSIENCRSDWTLSAVSEPVFEGNKSGRIEIRKDQPLVGSSQRIRSEVVIIKATEDNRFTPDIWYSFSIYFPSKGMEKSDVKDCINQWYEDGSQETTLRVQYDKAFMEVCPPENSRTKRKYDLFAQDLSADIPVDSMVSIPKDKWYEFVFHFIHAKGSSGLIEIWRDGKKIHEIHGRNMHLMYPKWKVGLYTAKLAESENYSRVIYFDNIRVGKTSATLADMSSVVSKK